MEHLLSVHDTSLNGDDRHHRLDDQRPLMISQPSFSSPPIQNTSGDDDSRSDSSLQFESSDQLSSSISQRSYLAYISTAPSMQPHVTPQSQSQYHQPLNNFDSLSSSESLTRDVQDSLQTITHPDLLLTADTRSQSPASSPIMQRPLPFMPSLGSSDATSLSPHGQDQMAGQHVLPLVVDEFETIPLSPLAVRQYLINLTVDDHQQLYLKTYN
jgi:hypothetical protein